MSVSPWNYVWQRVWQRMPVLLLVSVVAAAVAYVVVSRVGPTHTVHYSYLISLAEREDPPGEFRFDGYYAIQATDLFAATLASWIRTPEVVAGAYEKAGLPIPSADPRSLLRVVEAQKAAPQLVQVTVRGDSPGQAQALAAGLQTVLAEQIRLYHDEGIPAVRFNVVTTEPWQGTTRVATAVVVVATFAVALLLLINGVVLWESVKQHD